MENKPFSWNARMKSFRYAFEGLKNAVSGEHNTWIHLVATLACIVLSIITGVTRGEIFALIFVIALVWITELLNTSIEKLADFISKERSEEIKFIKDVSAAAVLVAAAAALITGCIIFIPKLF